MIYKYKQGVLGGTFDHLHVGHKDLLDTAFKLAESVTIGLATEKIYQQKFLSHLIEPYSLRELSLKNYLREKSFIDRAVIMPLQDIYGPTLSPQDFNAIFVTQTTLPNAEIINEERNKKELAPLEIITVPFRKDESGQVITSERIRLGEIDRDGRDFMNIFKNKTSLNLPANMRQEMRQPIGPAVKDIEKIKNDKPKQALLITVGDIVTKSFKEISCEPDIAIVDFRTRREVFDKELMETYTNKKNKFYTNKPGTIERNVVNVLRRAVATWTENHEKQTIAIDGEEDLLTLPAILLAPLGSIVCYGQFDLNAVIKMEASEENKKIIYNLLQKFE